MTLRPGKQHNFTFSAWTFQNFILALVRSLGCDAQLIHEPVDCPCPCPCPSWTSKPCHRRGYATCECDRAVQPSDVDGPTRQTLVKANDAFAPFPTDTAPVPKKMPLPTSIDRLCRLISQIRSASPSV